MKRTFTLRIPPLYDGLPSRVVFTSATQGDVWTQEELTRRLLNACHTFFTYSYNSKPRGGDILRLQNARCDFIAATSSFEQRFAPTSHYMTTHFFEFIDKDHGAYATLQEGPEHHHKLDMQLAQRTWTNPSAAHTPFSRAEQILRTYELRRILLERGHKPPTQELDK